jgi:hypothetical protein
MANRFYAVSRRVTVMEKVDVWWRMLIMVAVVNLVTQTVDASNPVIPTPFDERPMTGEPGDTMGFAQPDSLHQENQRWIF